MEKLTFTFKDLPPHDTFVIRLGEAGTVLPDAFEREIGARILSTTTRYLFAVILENDNGTYLLFVPEKKNKTLYNAKSAMNTLLTKTGLPPELVGTMKHVDFNALIEFGLFKRKPDVTEYFAKKQKDLPLTIDNVNLEAEAPEDAFEDYTYKINIGIITLDDHHRFLHMLKHVPTSEHVDPVGWTRPFDEDCPGATPPAWEFQVEQGSGMEEQMKALALEDEPSERKISVPASKGRRVHEDLEAQMAEGPKVRVRLGPLAVPGYDGILYIQKAKASKERGEAEWIETLGTALEEKGGGGILEETYDTAIELMEQGALPEVERDPNPDNKKSLAIHRCRTVVDNARQAKMSGAEFKRGCANIAKKHGTKESRGNICTQCSKPAHACTHYLVVSDMIWKPIAELGEEKKQDNMALFCSRKCEEKWSEVLICPACGTFDYVKTTGAQSYPDPKRMLDMLAQYHKRLLQHDKEIENRSSASSSSAGPVKVFPREVPRVEVPICTGCSATMLPRNPMAPHLHIHIAQLLC